MNYLMRRKSDSQYFVSMRPNTGLGDLTTCDPNSAKIYSNPWPVGFLDILDEWECVEVNVVVTPTETTVRPDGERLLGD